MAGLLEEDNTTSKKKDESAFGNFTQGVKGGLWDLPSTYSDPTLSPTNKRMQMLGQVASASPRLSRDISKINTGVNIYQGLSKRLDDWLNVDKGKKKEQSQTSEQAGQAAFNKNMSMGMPKLVGFLTNIIQGIGGLVGGGVSAGAAGAGAAGAGAGGAATEAAPVEVLEV